MGPYIVYPFVTDFFNLLNIFMVQPCCSLCWNSVHFCGWIFFSIAWIYPGSFLCSSMARHLGAFLFQAVGNGSAVAIHRQVLYVWCPHCIEEGSETELSF